MPYKWFVFVLVASIAVTIGLGLWKALAPYLSGFRSPVSAIESLSWFAVPWPLFLGLAYLGWPWIWLRIVWGDN